MRQCPTSVPSCLFGLAVGGGSDVVSISPSEPTKLRVSAVADRVADVAAAGEPRPPEAARAARTFACTIPTSADAINLRAASRADGGDRAWRGVHVCKRRHHTAHACAHAGMRDGARHVGFLQFALLTCSSHMRFVRSSLAGNTASTRAPPVVWPPFLRDGLASDGHPRRRCGHSACAALAGRCRHNRRRTRRARR